jgi:hypothetical protein
MKEGVVITYTNDAEIEEVIKNFEHCVYSPKEFTHARHLTVVAWYLTSRPREEALSGMRENLRRFTAHHGVQGYHETITQFWLRMAEVFLDRCPESLSFRDQVNTLVEHFPDKRIIFTHYSEGRLMSAEARAIWVDPDLKTLPQSGTPLDEHAVS